MKTKIFFIFSVIFSLVYLSTFAQSDNIIKETTLKTSDNSELTLNTFSGDIKVNSWSSKEISFKLTGSNDAVENVEVVINPKSDGNYEIKVKNKKNSAKNYKLKFEIKVPENFNLKMNTAGGDMNVIDIKGNITLNTSGGDLALKNISGNTTLNTSGGDIDVEGFNGDLSVSTSGGDISLTGANGKIEAVTSGGNVKVDYLGENKGIEITTSGGNILLTLPSDIKADFSFFTSGGEVEIHIPNTEYSKNKKTSKKGKINGGGNMIECTTSGGNIILENK